jgi:Raf kinase inhibitor-like YbhB/YbcL family protein
MELRSSGFRNRTTIPRRYTCDGDNVSPPLQWADAPASARSFVLLCDDPDAPAGVWHHWAAYDVAADQTELAEDAAPSPPGKVSRRPSMIFAKSECRALPAPTSMESTIIIFACWRSRWPICKSA